MKSRGMRYHTLWRGVALMATLLAVKSAVAGDIRFTADQSFPESVTWSARQHLFMVGSVKYGTVGKITPAGRYTTFIRDRRLVSTLGLLVDDQRNTLWVTNADPANGVRTSAATKNKLAAVATYDATTGKPRAYFDLSSLDPGGTHLANDLTLDAAGNAYVTDSFAPLIYRIDTQGQASIFARDPRFKTGDGFNLNGIVAHPDGYLLVGNSLSGDILRVAIDDPSKIDVVKLPAPLKSLDGFRLLDKEHLIVIQNGGTDRALVLASTDGWRSASIVREQKSRESMPTAAAIQGDKVYVLDSRIDVMHQPGSDKIRRFRLERFDTNPS